MILPGGGHGRRPDFFVPGTKMIRREKLARRILAPPSICPLQPAA
jgi:hypothetical protein